MIIILLITILSTTRTKRPSTRVLTVVRVPVDGKSDRWREEGCRGPSHAAGQQAGLHGYRAMGQKFGVPNVDQDTLVQHSESVFDPHYANSGPEHPGERVERGPSLFESALGTQEGRFQRQSGADHAEGRTDANASLSADTHSELSDKLAPANDHGADGFLATHGLTYRGPSIDNHGVEKEGPLISVASVGIAGRLPFSRRIGGSSVDVTVGRAGDRTIGPGPRHDLVARGYVNEVHDGAHPRPVQKDNDALTSLK